MAKKFRKIVFGVLAISMLLSSMASAHTEMDNMVFAGYDTTNPYAPSKIYNEIIDGKYTNKQVLIPIEGFWKFAGYESAYPHAGYDVLYLEGNAQKNIVRYNSLFPQWETRRSDYEWELKRPHYVWERQQTKINNKKWEWDFGSDDPRGNSKFDIPDSALKTKTIKTAVNVSYSMENYGFGAFNNQGAYLSSSERDMYAKFFVGSAINQWNVLTAASGSVAAASARKLSDSELISAINSGALYTYPLLSVARLSAVDSNGRYLVSDDDIKASIPVVKSEYITAQLNKAGNGKQTKNVAAEYLAHNAEWKDWDFDKSFKIDYDASISWTKPAFESAEPYNQYQYLIINGVVLNGENGKAKILRYTNGIASPKVEWKFAFFQEKKDEAGVYEVVEQKFLNGSPAHDVNGALVYRIPAGKFGKTYFVTTGSTVQYWVKDEEGHKTLLKETDKYAGNIGGYVEGYDTASYPIYKNVPKQP